MKKKLDNDGFFKPGRCFQKLFLTMKIATLLLFCGVLNAMAEISYSQSTKISLNLKNASVEDVLNTIENKSEFYFLLNQKLIDVSRKVDVVAENKSIKDVLDKVFDNTNVKYCVVDKQIILFPQTETNSMLQFQQQTHKISGTITDKAGNPLPGVNVVEKGTTNGTITDADGKYSLTNVTNNATLVFSFIGMKTQEIAVSDATTVNVVMEEETIGIDEVVVTSLGIEKAKKSLGYSVSELSGDNFTEAREVNLANSLAGKVAGVSVSNISTGASGSSYVVIRGNTSLSASNQPLYVIDGIPIDNSQMGTPGMYGGCDWGDGMSSINPDNIKSMTILKGNAAAALYGSRASNGVILITTKKGEKRQGVGVELTSNYVTESMIDYTDYQKEYGQGYYGVKPTSQSEAMDYGLYSYGAKLDGSSVVQYDGVSRPYSYAGNNRKNFYRTGSTWTNGIAFSGGNDATTYRFSASDMENKDIVPNCNMNRRTIGLNMNGKYGKRITASAKIEYSSQYIGNRTEIMDSPGNVNYAVYSLPPNIDVRTLKGTTSKLGAAEDGTELKFNGNDYVTNPYWAAYQFQHKTKLNRIISSMLLKYDFTDWLYIQGRIGTDWNNRWQNNLEPYGTAYLPLGAMSETRRVISETNTDVMVGWDHKFGDFGLNGFVGGNRMRHKSDYAYTGGQYFNIPFFQDIANLKSQSYSTSVSNFGINSLFGSAEFSFKNYLFLNATARKDWFSTLDGRSVLYPSVSLSWIFSETFKLPEWITFGKTRLSWAQVGGGVDSPYQTSLSYSLLGSGYTGETAGYVSQGTVPNTKLKPYKSTEDEAGLDLRMFQNRLGIDFTYYTKKTVNDILSSTISKASGYSSAKVNVGEVSNKGVELLINVGVIRQHDFSWDVSFNYAYNKNKVVNLAEGIETLTMTQSRTETAWLANIVGLPYSQIYGYKYRKDTQGRLVLDGTGLPLQSTSLYPLGTGICPTTMGLTNTFKYKNFYMSFLVDMRTGGHIYVASDVYGYKRGFNKNTLNGREDGLDISGVDESGNAVSYHIDATNVRTYYSRVGNITEQFVQNASFVKLRELTLGYNLPQSLLTKTPFADVAVSLVGRNLLILWRDTKNIDPESNYIAGNSQGLEGFGVPPTRSFGVNLSVKF